MTQPTTARRSERVPVPTLDGGSLAASALLFHASWIARGAVEQLT